MGCIRHRDKLHRTIEHTNRNDPHNVSLITSYKRYRNFCNSLLKKHKNNYEISLLKSAKSIKESWQDATTVLDYNKTKRNPNELFNLKDSDGVNKQFVNRNFANIGRQYADVVRVSETFDSSSAINNIPIVRDSIALLRPNETNIELIIINLKSNCATS